MTPALHFDDHVILIASVLITTKNSMTDTDLESISLSLTNEVTINGIPMKYESWYGSIAVFSENEFSVDITTTPLEGISVESFSEFHIDSVENIPVLFNIKNGSGIEIEKCIIDGCGLILKSCNKEDVEKCYKEPIETHMFIINN